VVTFRIRNSHASLTRLFAPPTTTLFTRASPGPYHTSHRASHIARRTPPRTSHFSERSRSSACTMVDSGLEALAQSARFSSVRLVTSASIFRILVHLNTASQPHSLTSSHLRFFDSSILCITAHPHLLASSILGITAHPHLLASSSSYLRIFGASFAPS
jgi:hypothetical protein